MMSLEQLWTKLSEILPFLFTIMFVVGALWLVDFAIKRRSKVRRNEWQFGRQVTMLILSVIAIVIVVIAVPVADAIRNQLLCLVGIAITAVIAISSTTCHVHSRFGNNAIRYH